MGVYFEFQGKVFPNEYHYLVEVSEKDADGVVRNPAQLRIFASTVLINGVAPEGVLTPVKIEKVRFHEMAKAEVFRGPNGAIYSVMEETTA
jgi:hypothetical protein